MTKQFADRAEAGRVLAGLLTAHAGRGSGVIVLGLPRGGVPVAAEVATALGAQLEVFVVRKVGVPGHRELAMGAIASGGVLVVNDATLERLGITRERLVAEAALEQAELARREQLYRGGRPPPELAGRVAVLVDDGLATGASMRAAVAAARALQPARVVVAVAVAPSAALDELAEVADEVVCALTPQSFGAVGEHYADFAETSDGEVWELLAAAG